jgi:hypothetical protein
MYNDSDARQIEVQIAEPLELDPSPSYIVIAIVVKLKKHKSASVIKFQQN